MEITTAPPADFLDERGQIRLDHDCKRCGYNLRGLVEAGRCPECGTPVGLSTRGDLLRFADPEWVDKVALGLKIILWMILVYIVVNLLGALLGPGSWFVRVTQAAALAVSFYGVWLMTEPDPSGIGEDPNLTARKIVRITLVIGLAGNVATIVASPTALSRGGVAIAVIAMITGLISLVGEFYKFVYYEQLARRIPDDNLAQRARFLKWALTITSGIATLGATGVVLLASRTGASRGLGVAGCLFAPVGLALLIFGLMTLLLLLRLRRATADQAHLARDSWAAAAFSAAI